MAAQVGLLAAPQTVLGWGMFAVGAGFLLLLLSLGTSWHLQRRRWQTDDG